MTAGSKLLTFSNDSLNKTYSKNFFTGTIFEWGFLKETAYNMQV